MNVSPFVAVIDSTVQHFFKKHNISKQDQAPYHKAIAAEMPKHIKNLLTRKKEGYPTPQNTVIAYTLQVLNNVQDIQWWSKQNVSLLDKYAYLLNHTVQKRNPQGTDNIHAQLVIDLAKDLLIEKIHHDKIRFDGRSRFKTTFYSVIENAVKDSERSLKTRPKTQPLETEKVDWINTFATDLSEEQLAEFANQLLVYLPQVLPNKVLQSKWLCCLLIHSRISLNADLIQTLFPDSPEEIVQTIISDFGAAYPTMSMDDLWLKMLDHACLLSEKQCKLRTLKSWLNTNNATIISRMVHRPLPVSSTAQRKAIYDFLAVLLHHIFAKKNLEP